MTKIEEVARALCRVWLFKAGRDILREGAAIDPVAMAGATYSGVDKHWRNFIEDAQAAIEAMREPTESMISAYWKAQGGDRAPCEETLDALIDAALTEKPE